MSTKILYATRNRSEIINFDLVMECVNAEDEDEEDDRRRRHENENEHQIDRPTNDSATVSDAAVDAQPSTSGGIRSERTNVKDESGNDLKIVKEVPFGFKKKALGNDGELRVHKRTFLSSAVEESKSIAENTCEIEEIEIIEIDVTERNEDQIIVDGNQDCDTETRRAADQKKKVEDEKQRGVDEMEKMANLNKDAVNEKQESVDEKQQSEDEVYQSEDEIYKSEDEVYQSPDDVSHAEVEGEDTKNDKLPSMDKELPYEKKKIEFEKHVPQEKSNRVSVIRVLRKDGQVYSCGNPACGKSGNLSFNTTNEQICKDERIPMHDDKRKQMFEVEALCEDKMQLDKDQNNQTWEERKVHGYQRQVYEDTRYPVIENNTIQVFNNNVIQVLEYNAKQESEIIEHQALKDNEHQFAKDNETRAVRDNVLQVLKHNVEQEHIKYQALDYSQHQALDYSQHQVHNYIRHQAHDYSRHQAHDYSRHQALDYNGHQIPENSIRAPHKNWHQPPHNKYQAPYNNQHQASHNSQHQAPHNSQHQAPHNSKYQAPYNSQHQAPYNSQHQAPYNSQHQVPHNSQHQVPHNSQHQVPHNSQHQVPHNSQNQVPHNFQHQVLHNNLHQAPHNSQHQAHDNNRHYTPDNIQHQAPDNSRHYAPYNSQHQVPDNRQHFASDNSQHQAPQDSRHYAPETCRPQVSDNSQHQAPDNRHHQVSDNSWHQVPDNSQHLAPANSQHQAPGNSRYFTLDNRRHQAYNNRWHQARDNRRHQASDSRQHRASDSRQHQASDSRQHQTSELIPMDYQSQVDEDTEDVHNNERQLHRYNRYHVYEDELDKDENIRRVLAELEYSFFGGYERSLVFGKELCDYIQKPEFLQPALLLQDECVKKLMDYNQKYSFARKVRPVSTTDARKALENHLRQLSEDVNRQLSQDLLGEIIQDNWESDQYERELIELLSLAQKKRKMKMNQDNNKKQQIWRDEFQKKFGTIECVITDIEGTTTAPSFVQDIICKFIRGYFPCYIRKHWNEDGLMKDIREMIALSKLYEEDDIPGFLPIPEIKLKPSIEKVTEFLEALILNYNWLFDHKPESIPARKLQSRVLSDGYRKGTLVGHVFEDVRLALEVLKEGGVKVCTYSNGSIFSQRLLFHYSTCGNLENEFDGYFDTSIGRKEGYAGYSFICENFQVKPERVVFFTDYPPEALAAKKAGIKVILMLRERDIPLEAMKEECPEADGFISSFLDAIYVPNCQPTSPQM